MAEGRRIMWLTLARDEIAIWMTRNARTCRHPRASRRLAFAFVAATVAALPPVRASTRTRHHQLIRGGVLRDAGKCCALGACDHEE